MSAFLQANWIPILVCISMFGIGYWDGVRDTNAKFYKKMAETSNTTNIN